MKGLFKCFSMCEKMTNFVIQDLQAVSLVVRNLDLQRIRIRRITEQRDSTIAIYMYLTEFLYLHSYIGPMLQAKNV